MKKNAVFVFIAGIALSDVVGQTVTPNYVETRVYQAENNNSTALVSREYSDGLGRSLQTKTHLNTAVGSDINAVANASLYDDMGRPQMVLKPFATTTGLEYQSDVASQISAYLYSEIAYFNDPLSRVREKSSPGHEFRIVSPLSAANRTVRYWYFGMDINDPSLEAGFIPSSSFGDINTTTNQLDRNTILAALAPLSASIGTDPRYFLSVTVDENNNVSQTLTDVFGKTIKTWSKKDNAGKIVSCYEYDILGNLVSATPPTDNVSNPLAPTAYTYNTLGQMLKKNLPGTGASADNMAETYEYDDAGRVVKINRLKNNTVLPYETISIDYDDFGRVISKRKEGSSTSDVEFFYDGYLGMSTARWGVLIDYLRKCSMSGSDADALIADLSSDDNGRSRLTASFAFNKVPTAHGILVRIVADFYIYDDFGRTARQYKSIPSIPLKKSCFGYDFMDRVACDTVFNKFTNMSVFAYAYDANGRLSGIYENTVEPSKLLVEYSYDDLGKLTAKRFAKYKDPSAKKEVAYAYGVRDWLTSIESGSSTDPNYFREDIFYENPPEDGESEKLRQYNGNISLAKYYYGTCNPIALKYSYDLVNRLVKTEAAVETSPGRTDLPFPASAYEEMFSHDDLGRINQKYVGRYGANRNTDTHNYSYYVNSARLAKVSNQSTEHNYFYDYYGNMIFDLSKKMATTYDWRNMPVKFTFYTGNPDLSSYTVTEANGTLTAEQLAEKCTGISVVSEVYMLYDAAGNRVIKTEKKL
jgi:YD repeat-containing protein